MSSFTKAKNLSKLLGTLNPTLRITFVALEDYPYLVIKSPNRFLLSSIVIPEDFFLQIDNTEHFITEKNTDDIFNIHNAFKMQVYILNN